MWDICVQSGEIVSSEITSVSSTVENSREFMNRIRIMKYPHRVNTIIVKVTTAFNLVLFKDQL